MRLSGSQSNGHEAAAPSREFAGLDNSEMIHRATANALSALIRQYPELGLAQQSSPQIAAAEHTNPLFTNGAIDMPQKLAEESHDGTA